MMDMSDEETVIRSDWPADASSPRHQPERCGNRADDVRQCAAAANLAANLTESYLAKQNGNRPGASEGSVAAPDAATQHQDGAANPKALNQQRANKRRGAVSSAFKHPAFGKRRRSTNSDSESVLPTNFLLGGNIFDPLNLNSLLDEEVNRALNAETPKSSPLPAKGRDPVEILIPRDITDPLNLNGCTRGDAGVVLTPLKSGGGRRRHRNRHHGGTAARGGTGRGQEGVDGGEGGGEGVARELNQSERCLGSDSESALESSGIKPQNGSDSGDAAECSLPSKQGAGEETDGTRTPAAQRQRKRRRSGSRSENAGGPCWYKNQTEAPEPTQRRNHNKPNPRTCGQQQPNQQQQQKKKKFQYGNYNQYYGYRNPGASEDPRLRIFKPDWFQGKEVLDLGCNTGHMTLTIAKHWRPARIVGLDIDGALIHAAKQNIRHYLSEVHTLRARGERDGEGEGEGDNERDRAKAPPPDGSRAFPVSLCVSRGPIAPPPLPNTHTLPPGNFPANVTFVKGNYVLECDVLLETQREEFDVILCLSVTKWIHLNWGDVGLRRFFRRAYRHLRPGGLFVLEPQPWSSYGKRKNLTETIYQNYFSIQLKPEQFSTFLTADVGFSSYELLGAPGSSARGFQRPIYLFHKGPAARE